MALTYSTGAGSCRKAAGAAKRHAGELEEAKADVKAAIRDAIDANDELDDLAASVPEKRRARSDPLNSMAP